MSKAYTLLGVVQFAMFMFDPEPHFYIAGVISIGVGAILLQMERNKRDDT